MDERFLYHQWLAPVSNGDVVEAINKDTEYGASWKKRGGTGAFHVMWRKVDRIEEQVKKHGYDIFEAVATDPRKEGVIDDIRDLRRYLLLLEAELINRNALSDPRLPEIKGTTICKELEVGGKIQMERPFGYDEEEEEVD